MIGASSFVDRGIADDDRTLSNAGIDSFSDEAVPYYSRWIRQDIILACYLLNRITLLLVLIAIPLWIMALR